MHTNCKTKMVLIMQHINHSTETLQYFLNCSQHLFIPYSFQFIIHSIAIKKVAIKNHLPGHRQLKFLRIMKCAF